MKATAAGEPTKIRWKNWTAPLFLISLGLLQAVQLKYFKLDWPSIVLIIIGVALFFLPLREIGALVESLEFGKTKILFRKTRELQQSVDQAILEAAEKADLTVEIQQPATQTASTIASETTKSAERFTYGTGKAQSPWSFYLSTLGGHKESALIRLSRDIETALAKLAQDNGMPIPPAGIIWGKVVPDLVSKDVISSETANALIQFRNVRNRIVHSSSLEGPSDRVILSTIDSGLKLLNLLTQGQIHPTDAP